MPPLESNARLWPTSLRTTALCALLGGFALELVAIAVSSWVLFKIGLFLFVIGVPCYLFGLFCGRRN